MAGDEHQKTRVDQLYFGRDDAESDAGSVGLLRAGFLRTAAYDAAISGKKQLVIGRKGAGKSAICVMLAAAEAPRSSVVTPDEISADELRRFELHGVPRQTAKQFVWRYVLALQLAKIVIRHAETEHKKRPPSVDRLRDFLAANDEPSADPRWHDRFWKTIHRLRSSLKLEAFGVTASLDLGSSGDGAPEGLRIGEQLDIVETRLRQALVELQCPAGHGTLIIIVDQLEKIWSNDEDSDDMVIGLLSAAKHISAVFPNVRCVVCVRSDIYDSLQFAERDKFRGDEMRIDWSPHTLVDMLVARAAASLGAPLTSEELFGVCFTDTVQGRPTTLYLVERTLMRPRELIQLANLCRDTAAKNGHSRILEADILEAEVQYSVWKIQDLVTEYALTYPFLNDLLVLFQSAPYLVKRSDLADRMGTLAATLSARYQRFADVFTPSGVATVLYGIGFLGVRRNEAFAYSYEGGLPLDGDEQEFCLHPCFRQALRAVTASRLAQYEPLASWVRVEHLAQRGGWLGADVNFRGSQGYLLFDAVDKAALRALSLVDDADLAPELRDELRASLLRIRKDTHARRSEDGSIDASLEHAQWVVGFLRSLRADLSRLGNGQDEPTVLAGRIDRIARNLDDAVAGELSGQPRPSEIS